VTSGDSGVRKEATKSSSACAVVSSNAVVSLADEGQSSMQKALWFEPYLAAKESVIALDIEFVSKPLRTGVTACRQHIATIDIVDFHLNTIYSSSVYHAPGSFNVNRFTKALNSFEVDYFSDPT